MKSVRWLSSYLTGRQVTVSVRGHRSSAFQPTAGVPQGSCLGPVLYLIFVNDFPLRPTQWEQHSQFADDIGLFAISQSVTVAARRLQDQLNRVGHWCGSNMTALNVEKTQLLLISKSRRHLNKSRGVELSLFGQQVKLQMAPKRKVISVSKFLGVKFDSQLTFKWHFDDIAVKTSRRINMLKAIRGFGTRGAGRRAARIIYLGFIRPLLEYGCVAWCASSKAQLKRLQILQNRSLRVVTKVHSIDEMHDLAGVATINDRLRDLSARYLQKAMLNNPIVKELIQQDASNDYNVDRFLTPLAVLDDWNRAQF
jgi:ribonucleases P/MRP protein subunit RPP40